MNGVNDANISLRGNKRIFSHVQHVIYVGRQHYLNTQRVGYKCVNEISTLYGPLPQHDSTHPVGPDYSLIMNLKKHLVANYCTH